MKITLAAICLLLCGATAHAAPFAITGLLDTGGRKGDIFDVNDFGQFAGTFSDFETFNGNSRAFFYDGSAYIDLGDLGGGVSHAFALNNSAEITGWSELSFLRTAYVYRDGTMDAIEGAGGETLGYAINDHGAIAGQFRTGLDKTQPFLYREGEFLPLGNLGGTSGAVFYGEARGVNLAGQVVGESMTSDFLTHAFLYTSEAGMIDLGTLGGSFSSARAINRAGQIVGTSTTAEGSSHSFLYENGVMTSIAPASGARDINDYGHVLISTSMIYHGGQSYYLEDINALAMDFLSDGSTPGFTNLLDIQALSNGYFVGTGDYFDGESSSLRYYVMSFSMPEFVWEGAEGFAFDHAPNWSDGVVPGAGDTVQLTAPGQLKAIEFAAGALVTNQRLVASDGSQTDVDLAGGVWQIGVNGNSDGELELSGANLTIKNGMLEIFGTASLTSGGAAGNLLEASEGGKIIVRGNGPLFVGDDSGNRPSALLVQGDDSLLEATVVFLGFLGGGEVTAMVNSGGLLRADLGLHVGGSAPAELVVTGTGSSGASKLELAPGGALLVGSGSGRGSVTIENGAVADLLGAAVALGQGSEAEFTVSGEGSRVEGGNFRVHQKGVLSVSEGEAQIESLAIDGGQIFFRHGALVSGFAATGAQSAAVEMKSGVLAIESGASFTTGRLLMESGQTTISGGGLLRVHGTEITDAVVGMGGEEGVALPSVVEVSGSNSTRKSQLITEGPLLVGFLGQGSVRVREGASAQIGADLRIVSDSSEQFSFVLVSGSDSSLTARNLALVGNGATLIVEDGAVLSVEPGENGPGSTTINGSQASLAIGGTASLGKVTQEAGNFVVMAGTARAMAASVEINGGVLAVTAGRLETPQLTLNGGVLMGKGRIQGNVTQNGGQILPGASPGVLTIEGGFTQNGGKIVLEIGGAAAGTQYDQFVVTENFSLMGGTIELSFINGFAPQTGQAFTFFEVGGLFTSDATFLVTGLEDGWEFDTAFDPGTGAFGLTSLNDGISAVPEPATLALCVAAGLLALNHRLRRKASA